MFLSLNLHHFTSTHDYRLYCPITWSVALRLPARHGFDHANPGGGRLMSWSEAGSRAKLLHRSFSNEQCRVGNLP